VDDGAHAPEGCAQVDQADQVPSAPHVRVWVPQLPHGSELGPEHVHFPALHVPLAHFLPHPPQLFASLVVSTQAPEHAVYPLLQATPHLPLAHAGCPCTGTGQTESQLPQWFASVSVFTHELPHTVWEHVLAHFAGIDDASQIAATPEQVVLHDPQLIVVSSAVSHPSVGSPLQSPNPVAHDDAGNAHAPASQLTLPLTWGKFVQSFEHVPHVLGSDKSVLHPVPIFSQSAKPLWQ
jgi:hypothetical protein